MAAALLSVSSLNTPLSASLDNSVRPTCTRFKLSDKNHIQLKSRTLWRNVSFVVKATEDESNSSTATSVREQNGGEEKTENEEVGMEEKNRQQETDWKVDEEFKKFMGNPSIEAAVKLEKQRAERRLRELDKETAGRNIFQNFFAGLLKNSLVKEKERLEKAEEEFKALDLNKDILVCVQGTAPMGVPPAVAGIISPD